MTSGVFQTNPMPRLIVAIRGMVGLQDDKGDWHTRQQIEHYFDVVTEVSQESDGIVSSYENDAAFITFSHPGEALKATVKILDRLMEEVEGGAAAGSEALDSTTQVVPLQIRLGMHYGPLDVDMGTLSGSVMDLTKKMVTRAKPNQIIVSQDLLNAIKEVDYQTKPLGSVSDGGNNVDMIEIVTEHAGKVDDTPVAQAVASDGVTAVVGATQTVLSFQGTTVTVGAQQPVVVMGRDLNNDFIVNVETASRQHARVEFDNGTFVISDHSTNGTYVQPTGGQAVFIKQQAVQLQGSGVISLGQPITEHSLLIQYMCQ